MKKTTKKPLTRTTKPKLRHVLVTTVNRGVFIGQTDAKPGAETVVLSGGRNVFHWVCLPEGRGFIGIATHGLAKGSKVGPSADALEVRNVTSVINASPAAVETWAKAGWGT